MGKTLPALVLLTAVAAFSAADTVFLTNRHVVPGTVIETRDQSIVVDSDEGVLEIPKEMIEKIEYSDRFSSLKRRNAAVEIRAPMYSIISACSERPFLCLLGQTAFSRSFAIGSFGWIGSDEGELWWGVLAGPELRPGGDYLEGLSLGFYAGVEDVSDWYGTHVSVRIELGYQQVHRSGTVFGLVSGVRIVPGNPLVYAMLQLGVTFKHPFIKAKSPDSAVPGRTASFTRTDAPASIQTATTGLVAGFVQKRGW